MTPNPDSPAKVYEIDAGGLVKAADEHGRIRFDCYDYTGTTTGEVVYSVSFEKEMFERFVRKYFA